jgi:hypothetical protein
MNDGRAGRETGALQAGQQGIYGNVRVFLARVFCGGILSLAMLIDEGVRGKSFPPAAGGIQNQPYQPCHALMKEFCCGPQEN